MELDPKEPEGWGKGRSATGWGVEGGLGTGDGDDGAELRGGRGGAGEERERTTARLRTRGPSTRLSPRARQAAALRDPGSRPIECKPNR